MAAPAPAPAAAAPSAAPPKPKPEEKAKDKKTPASTAPASTVPAAAASTALPTRPNEPEFKMEMSLDTVTFDCTSDKKPVWCDLTIKNITPDRQSFKVKCTSAEIFRVQPPMGFIKAGESKIIRVWFQNKEEPEHKDQHYFAFYHVKAADEKVKNEKDLWTKNTKPDGVRRIRAVFQDKKA